MTFSIVARVLTVGISSGNISFRLLKVVPFRTRVVIRAIVHDLNKLVVTLV